MDDQELSALLKNHATRHQASDRLRASVVTHIALRSAARGDMQSIRARFWSWWQWAGFGGPGVWSGFASGVVLTVAVFFAWPLVHQPSLDSAELLALHVHGLGAGPLFAVASSDRHTVKPWFQGKLDYAPQVLDLATDGFVLVGGRTDSLNSQPSATLVYGAKKHFITVFERPTDRGLGLTLAQQRGFNIAHWSAGGMEIWAVSDLEAGELEHFGRAWTQSVGQSTTKS